MRSFFSFLYCNIGAMFLVLVLLFFISCSKDDQENGVFVDEDEVAGTYIGVFTDQNNHEKAEKGNVTITKLSNGTFTVELLCDGHDIHAKAEGVRIYDSSRYTNIKNDYGDDFPIWWHINGWFSDDGLSIFCYKRIYGKPVNDDKDVYYFLNGKKRK